MKKKWSSHLLAIPKILLVDIIAFMIGAYIDIRMMSNQSAQGHGAPVATMVVIMIFSAITLGVTVFSLVRAMVAYVSEKKGLKNGEIRTEESEMQAHVNDQNISAANNRNWRYLTVVIVQAVISIILVYMCGSYEINSFYNDPNHIGFAIPIMTFMLAGVLFILFLLSSALMIFFYRRGKKKEKR